MNKYKVKYTLNEKFHWTNILAENEHTAAKNVYKQISEAYPDDDYEYMDVESDFDDGEVMEGTSFITDGYEYKWIGRMGGSVHLDFDNWAVWAAENQDTNEIQFFIVEEDTGFIDWGPVDTAKEATEFLQSKIDDYNEDEALVENSKKIIYNVTEDLEETSQVIDDDTSNHGMLGLVNSLIISEYDAIDQYNSAMATAEAEGNIDIIPVLKDIIAEEHTHVGQLQAAAKLFDQSANNVDKGKEEATDQLEKGAVEETELNDITEE